MFDLSDFKVASAQTKEGFRVKSCVTNRFKTEIFPTARGHFLVWKTFQKFAKVVQKKGFDILQPLLSQSKDISGLF